MFLFTDVETTGLDPNKGLLLEVAIVITDNDLAEVASRVEVIHHGRLDIDTLRTTGKIDGFVQNMHTENGLWEECEESPTRLLEAEERLLAFIKRYTEARTVPMAGNTIHFDRSWLKVHMPLLEAHYSHRNVDMSTVTELMKRWNNPVWEDRPGGKQTDKPPHRALADCRQSIALAKHYRVHMEER